MIGGMKGLKAMLALNENGVLWDYGHSEVMLLHSEQYLNTLLNELDD